MFNLVKGSWWCALAFALCTVTFCHGQVIRMNQNIIPDEAGDRNKQSCNILDNNARFDCFPGYWASEEKCVARGCCWKLPNFQNMSGLNMNIRRPVDIPYCFFPENYEGYSVIDQKQTDYGFSLVLERKTLSGWPGDVMKLQVEIWLESKSRIHFKIFDPNSKRYEVPINTPKFSKKAPETDYILNIQKSPFGIKITRKSTGISLFDSTLPGAPLIFADQFLQMTTHTGSGLVYGLGEHMTSLLLSNTSWQQLAMWNRDINPQFNSNLYGTHPFYLNLEDDGNAHGVFLLNSNAMDINLQPLPALTFRTIGGVLDFYVFSGPSGDNVIQQYTDVIGKSYMPPYWALGYHLCRWGYGGSEGMRKVINRNRALGIPYEVQWNDIDYMAAKRDWTYDKNNFAELPDIIKDLHSHGQKYVIIVDPAISNTLPGEYPPYDEGLEDGIFIINNQTKKPLVGMVWPGATVFPDFTHPKSTDWWYNQAQDFHVQIPFDGLWIDMNDPSSELYGSTTGCSGNRYDNPPYLPGIIGGDRLPSRTICPSSLQHVSSHYDLHNIYGLSEAKATDTVLKKLLNKRSLIISRSTFPSQGLYGGHWTGDIHSTWQDMQFTIPAMLKFNMFGMPLVGSDICGFAGDTNEELCVRWTQLGSFYPFMRNHNTLGAKDQDPASFSYRAQKMMKMAIEIRYSLLPYLYTLFYHSHVSGDTVARPLFFNFPKDPVTQTIDRQFMWGKGLLVSPVLDQGQTTVKGYFPRGRWYDLYEGMEVSGGVWNTLSAPLEKINVHVHGGSILPLQQPNVTTVLSRTQPFHLLVAPAENGTACGDLFWDDGDNLESIEKGLYNLIQFKAVKGQISSTLAKMGYDTPMTLGTIRILGMASIPQSVNVNGKPAKFLYKENQKELLIENLSLDLKSPFTAQWK